jgi:hypothetical protein
LRPAPGIPCALSLFRRDERPDRPGRMCAAGTERRVFDGKDRSRDMPTDCASFRGATKARARSPYARPGDGFRARPSGRPGMTGGTGRVASTDDEETVQPARKGRCGPRQVLRRPPAAWPGRRSHSLESRAEGRAPLTREGIAGRFCRLGLLTGMVSDIASKRSAMLHMRVPPAGKLAVSTSPTRPGFSGRKRWSTHVVQL